MKYDEKIFEYILDNGKTLVIDSLPLPDKNCLFTRRSEIGLGSFLCGLTTEEQKEIAEYMIELWKEWAK